eukprot:905801_1
MVVFTLRTSWVHHMAQSLEQLIKKQITSGKGQSCPFERIEMTRSEAEEMFKFNKYKLEIIRDIFDSDKHGRGGNKGVTESVMVYRCGDLIRYIIISNSKLELTEQNMNSLQYYSKQDG